MPYGTPYPGGMSPIMPGQMPGLGGAPTVRPSLQAQTQGALPTIQGPVRLNPDGSAMPSMGGGGGGLGAINVPTGRLSGLAGQLAGGQPQAEALNADPALLATSLATNMGMDPFAGLADLIGSVATPDQLNTLISLLGTTQDVGVYPQNSLEARAGLLQSMMGSGAQMPTISQVLGPAVGQGMGNPNNPLYGLLSGGTPGQQTGQLLSAVMDLAGASGMDQLQAAGLARRLDALSRQYLTQQYGTNPGGQAGGGTPFIDWLQQQAPSVAHLIFGQ